MLPRRDHGFKGTLPPLVIHEADDNALAQGLGIAGHGGEGGIALLAIFEPASTNVPDFRQAAA